VKLWKIKRNQLDVRYRPGHLVGESGHMFG
jgi:hypothetical protein